TFEIPVIRQEVEEKGRTYGYQLVHQEVAQPPLDVQANFGSWAAGPMLQVQAIHLADHRPYVYEDRWVCLQTVHDIREADLQRESANEWLVRHQHYDRLDLRIYARKATERDAGLMGIAGGEALLVLERTTWIDQRLITSVRSITRPDYQLVAST
ncbi:MAG: UTRA domain-containing protein, partial [Thiothrix sp.]|nr:UTRA domain-containing protein [Thiothrix sp.]